MVFYYNDKLVYDEFVKIFFLVQLLECYFFFMFCFKSKNRLMIVDEVEKFFVFIYFLILIVNMFVKDDDYEFVFYYMEKNFQLMLSLYFDVLYSVQGWV